MSDLISRQAAIDIMLMAIYDDWKPDYATDRMNELLSAQPEIIRCGQCKHCYIDGENVRFNVCELNHNKVQSDDWFCADAERREE